MDNFLVEISEIKACPGGELTLERNGVLLCGEYEADISLLGKAAYNEGCYNFKGRICGSLSGFCGRCLAPVSLPYDEEIEFSFSNTESALTDGDTFAFEGSIADFSLVLSGIIRADAPISVLCKEDCKGLCEVCGRDLNTGFCSCRKELMNPVFDINLFNNNGLEGR